MLNPYLVLGLREDAGDADVRAAYLRLLQDFPPETHAERFQAISEAYNALRDEAARAEVRLFGTLRTGDGVAELIPPGDVRPRRAGMAAWIAVLEEKPNG